VPVNGAKLGYVLTYALVTPARDEAENLRRLAESVLAQSVAPSTWIVVDDGSTDGTWADIERLGRDHDWIRIVSSPGATTHSGTLAVGRGAGRDIVAFNAGVAALENEPDVLVKLDADVSFEPDFFERILREFEADTRLGITGGECFELEDGEWHLQPVTGSHVRGATRSYRWACWKDVRPLEERLGWDGIDHMKAEEREWRVRSVPGLPFLHHRPLGERDGLALARWARVGHAAYYMGYRFPYLVLRSLHRGRRDPGAVAIIWGYLVACARRESRYPDTAVRDRLRERQRLRNLPQRAREARGPQRPLAESGGESTI
jgi:glycosyltransferase involved in cell wall biosynthesis